MFVRFWWIPKINNAKILKKYDIKIRVENYIKIMAKMIWSTRRYQTKYIYRYIYITLEKGCKSIISRVIEQIFFNEKFFKNN